MRRFQEAVGNPKRIKKHSFCLHFHELGVYCTLNKAICAFFVTCELKKQENKMEMKKSTIMFWVGCFFVGIIIGFTVSAGVIVTMKGTNVFSVKQEAKQDKPKTKASNVFSAKQQRETLKQIEEDQRRQKKELEQLLEDQRRQKKELERLKAEDTVVARTTELEITKNQERLEALHSDFKQTRDELRKHNEKALEQIEEQKSLDEQFNELQKYLKDNKLIDGSEKSSTNKSADEQFNELQDYLKDNKLIDKTDDEFESTELESTTVVKENSALKPAGELHRIKLAGERGSAFKDIQLPTVVPSEIGNAVRIKDDRSFPMIFGY